MTRNSKPAILQLPGFVPSSADVNPSPQIAFVRESNEILTHNKELDVHNHQDFLLNGNWESILPEDHLLFDPSMHFDHDIPERVCMRALLARAVC